MSDLAIIIPAYKIQFFNETLDSIANQTSLDFTLYIGNDASPYNLKEVVEKFEDRIKIVYKEFPDNMGGHDLVGHWERCIEMTNGEEWLWLFSDDDLMDSNCVKLFYETILLEKKYDLYHFNVVKIDENGKIIGRPREYPLTLSAEEFLLKRCHGKVLSFAVEYIFRRDTFFNAGRFQKFDLAWGSDDGTWIKVGQKNGIRTINGPLIHWRTSRYNITPNYNNNQIIERKFMAQIAYVNWILQLNRNGHFIMDIPGLVKSLEFWFIKSMRLHIRSISFRFARDLIIRFYEEVDFQAPVSMKIYGIYLDKMVIPLKTIIKKLVFYDYLKSKIMAKIV